MLPYAQLAIVDPSKVRDYLLSASHPVGRFKAAVFTRLGYRQDEWTVLQADLLALARHGTALLGRSSIHGVKYEVSDTLIGPNGRAAVVTTVWLLKHGESTPRLITAFPG